MTAMPRLPLIACAALTAALLSACSTPKLPERFHTLLPIERATPVVMANPIYVDVLPVKVPEQVDHTQWVVRQPDDSLLMLEQDRWAAPLQDEIRGALVERLTSQWGAIDVRSVAQPQPSVWRVRVDVQRFESIPSREARIEGTWSVASTASGGPTLVCRSALREDVSGTGIAPLAAAHRRAVVRLSDEIGQRLKALQAGNAAGCGA
jgi:uncharacterized lipoprotein YmbA